MSRGRNGAAGGANGARRATGAAPAAGRGGKGRWSALIPMFANSVSRQRRGNAIRRAC